MLRVLEELVESLIIHANGFLDSVEEQGNKIEAADGGVLLCVAGDGYLQRVFNDKQSEIGSGVNDVGEGGAVVSGIGDEQRLAVSWRDQ